MKRLSLVKQTLVTDFMNGLAFILLGIYIKEKQVFTASLPTWVVLVLKAVLILFVAAPMIQRLFFRKKFDVWDETAKEHRMEAREMTFLLLQAVLLMTAVCFVGGKGNSGANGNLQTTWLEADFFFIVYGASQIFQSLCFIFLEKRGV